MTSSGSEAGRDAKARTLGRIAWSVAGFALLLAGLAVFVAILNEAGTLWEKVGNAAVVSIPYPIVGALILSRTGGNPIGWVFCAVGIFQGLNVFGDEYSRYALLTNPGSIPGGYEMSWLAFWTWMPSLALLVTFLLLFFPEGRPPSPRWRWVGWVSGVGIALIVLPVAIAAWPTRGTGLETMHPAGGVEVDSPILVLVPIGAAFVVIGAIASITSLVARFRRSTGEERLQIKWFMFAGGLAFLTIALAFTPIDLAGWTIGPGLAGIPVAVGIAILRYRLYDIDRLINRTLVYVFVTGFLALVYVGLVLVLGDLVATFGSSNSLAVAGATLAVAALFRPVRSRVQAFIDRRFYRSKYDANQIIESFNARLRDETDLEVLTEDLVGVVQSTMQPMSVSVWLRSADPPRV